jgi:hypothetical protein
MEGLWSKMAAELGKGLPRAAFTLAQYAAVAGAYAERGVSAEDAAPVAEANQRALAAYVEEAVEAHFRVFTGWVKKVEAAALAAAKSRGVNFVPGAPSASAGAGATVSYLPPDTVPVVAEPAEAETVVRDFALNWRAGLSGLNDDVSRFFGRGADAGSKVAPAVLMALFQKVAEFHGRFTAAVARAFPGNPPFTREIVALPTVYAEMRRYGRQG